MKKKDVFVWVARDKKAISINTYCIFEGQPIFNGDYFSQNLKVNEDKILGELNLKKGQCKKYKLVEVKEQ